MEQLINKPPVRFEQAFNKYQIHLDPNGHQVNVVFIKKINKVNNQVKLLVEDINGVNDTITITNLLLAKNGFLEGDALILNAGGLIKADKHTVLTTHPSVTPQNALEERVYIFSNTGSMVDEIVRLNAIPAAYVLSTLVSDVRIPGVDIDPGAYRYVITRATLQQHDDMYQQCVEVNTFVTVTQSESVIATIKAR